MPRARKSAAEQLVDQPLFEPGILGQDPAPPVKRPPGRPRKATTAPAGRTGTRGRISARDSTGKIMSKAEKVEKVSAELYTWFAIGVGAWEIRDPECASVMWETVRIPGVGEAERLEMITARTVSIIARNDKVLDTLAASGIIGEAAILGKLLFDVGKRVMAHHGPLGVGHNREDESVQADRYPVYAGG